MKYIGIDYGTKKTGIAVSDELGTIAFPRDVFMTDSFLPNIVADMIIDEDVSVMVLGESLNLQGGFNEVARDARKFAKLVQELLYTQGKAVEVLYEDERFTTKQARALPSEGKARGDVANKGRAPTVAKAMVDKQAAALILQSFLDKRQNMR